MEQPRPSFKMRGTVWVVVNLKSRNLKSALQHKDKLGVQMNRWIFVGIILLVFGVTLAATSYFKIYDTVERITPTSRVLPIQANSSSYFNFWPFFGSFPQSQQALVVVSGSQELQGILNSTLNYNSTMKYGQNITISLVEGNQSISATVRSVGTPTYSEPIAAHVFDIPASWWAGFWIRVNNPESYPVCWIVNVMLYGQVVNNYWLTTFFVGMVSIILGLIIVGVAGYRRKAINKKEA